MGVKVSEIPKIVSVIDLKVDFQDSLDWYTGSGVESSDGIFKFADQIFQIECKHFATPANPLAVSGSQLAGLEDARHALQTVARQKLEAFTASINDYYALAADLAAGSQVVVLGGAAVVVDSDHDKAAYLCTLYKKTLALRRSYQGILGALLKAARSLRPFRKLFFLPFVRRIYCGFGWSKRAAALFHGAHPPRATILAVVMGCA